MRLGKNILLAVIAVIMVAGWSNQAQAVVNFSKHAGNPVFFQGGSGAFDEAAIEIPRVIKDGGIYKMWYTGEDASGSMRIGYATSLDGLSWTRENSGNPVLSAGSAGAWDSAHVGAQWVMKEGGTYKMWYAGTDDPTSDGNVQIGYATSSDGVSWTRYNGGALPVLPKGGASDWDGGSIFAPAVINDNGIYKMWYAGADLTGNMQIGYAESPDGMVWTKNAAPVFMPGPAGAWDERDIETFTVIREDGTYRMWFMASESEGMDRIGYAYSLNGISWRKYHGNPIVMEGNQATDDFDEFGAYDPMVIKDGNVYKMWYVGDENCVQAGEDWTCTSSFGYAESPAYAGGHAAIGKMQVHSTNRLGNVQLSVAVLPEGPGPLDMNELKVEGPNGFSYAFSDSDIQNNFGGQSYKATLAAPVENGTYTFTLKTNSGLTDTDSLNFTYTAVPNLSDGTAPGQLDRQINDGPAHQVYAGSASPTFKWKPSAGDGYYYWVQVQDWEKTADYYHSARLLGSSKDANGYLSVTVPAGVLPADTPMLWRVQALDTNDTWSAHNRSNSNWYAFYTGVKDQSATPDFISTALMRSERSYRAGDRAIMMLDVINLAPWDIDEFLVASEGGSPVYYTFNPGSDADTSPTGFDYFASISGIAPNATATGYVFAGRENTNLYSESMADTFQDDPSVPRVSRKDMLFADNAYLATATPTLSWISQGDGYRYRVRIRDWNGAYPPYTSSNTTGLPAGEIMSVDVPAGVLQAGSPYHWEVEVSDVSNNSRTRSQRLSFTIVSQTATVSGTIDAGTSGYTSGNIFIGAYSGPDPGSAVLVDSTMIGNIADTYALNNLPVGARVYIWAFWDNDGNGVLTAGEYVGTTGEVTVPAGGVTAPALALNDTYSMDEGSPYFAAATVLAVNSPNGVETAFSTQVMDPNGTLPGSIASITVTAPGGAAYSLTAADFSAPNNYYHAFTGLLAEGEYLFTATDAEGKSAVTYVYFKPGATIPIPDTNSFQAAGTLPTPILSWSAVSGYEGNVFYRARIFDESGAITIWTSGFSQSTSVQVPSGILSEAASYKWRVEAFDAYQFYASNQRAYSAKIALTVNNTRPYFNYVLAHKRSDNGVITLALEAGVADPDGTLPGSIASIVVTAPGGATYNLLSTDFGGSSYYQKFEGFSEVNPPPTGIYTFTVSDGTNTATSYDFMAPQDIPVVDTTSMQAFGDPLAPTLSWGAPGLMDRPLYFRARVFDETGTTTLWTSNRIPGTTVQVPSGILQNGVFYRWQVHADDASNGIHSSNQSRSPQIDLTIDNNRPNFRTAMVFKRHASDGFYTLLNAAVSDPDGTVPDTIASLTVTGPNSFSYTFQPGDFKVAFGNSYIIPLTGRPDPGVYTFTITDSNGGNSAVTHDIVMAADDVPVPNLNSVLVSGDPSAPAVSWSGVSGFAGRLFYRLRVWDASGNFVYASAITPNTAQTIPAGILLVGQNYQMRVEAYDHPDMIVFNTYSDTGWLPLSGQSVPQYTAGGTYTYMAGSPNTLTLDTVSSDFICDGPEQGGSDVFEVIWNSATEAILEEPDGYQMTWTRASGTLGDILGAWQMTEGSNTFEMTFNGDGSFVMIGNIVECNQGGDEEGSETYSVWTGISRSMTAGGTTDTKILHFHLWAPTGTVSQVYVAAPTHPPDPANYTFTQYETSMRGDVMVDNFSKDVPITVNPEVGDLYIFTVTKVGADPDTVNQTLGEIILDAPLVTTPANYDLVDANLGNVLGITWTAPAAFTADDIMIMGGACAPGGSQSVTGTVTSATNGAITLPNLAGATGAYFDIRVHHGDHVFSHTKYDFGTCDYTPDTIPPTTPTGLTATPAGSGQIDLSWTASTDNNWVEGYKVYRDGSEIFTTTATTFSDTNVAAYTQYCYTVKAYDHANNFSDPSSQACATTLPAFNAYSYHNTDGYYINSFVDDPGQQFSAVSVSGPGIEAGVSMNYIAASSRWELPASVALAGDPPTGGRTYTFTATPEAGGDNVIGSVTVSVYVENFATNLQPTGDVTTAQPTFSWDGFTGVSHYTVIVGEYPSRNWIWTSDELPPEQTSVVYAGPALTVGQEYIFSVIASINTDGNSNSSFADALFTYVGVNTITVQGIVKAWNGSVLPAPGATVTLVGDPTRTATSSTTDGSFSLSGVPADTPFSLKFSKDGYLDVYSADITAAADVNISVDAYGGTTPFQMPAAADLTAFGAMPDAGMALITGRVTDQPYRSANVGGVVVTATGSSATYPVIYRDPFGVLSSTPSNWGFNGQFYVLNVAGGDTVTLTASKPGWVFGPRTYHPQANAVSQGRILGTAPGYDGSFSGFVKNSAGAAVSGATVALSGEPGKSTLTTGDGSYTFSGLPRDATFYAKVTAGGYVPLYAGRMSMPLQGAVSGINMTLRTAAEMSAAFGVTGSNALLTCKVFDQTMIPLSGVTVILSSRSGTSYTPLYSGGGQSTDGTGGFAVPNILPGDVVKVEVAKAGYTFPPVYLDGFASSVTGRYIVGAGQSLPGDINADNSVNLADAILALKAISGLNSTGVSLSGDVSGDGRIGLAEVIYILQDEAGLRTGASTPSVTPYTSDANTILLDHFDGTTGASILAFSETGASCGPARPSATPSSSYGAGPDGLNQALTMNPPASEPVGSGTYLQYPGGQLLSQPNGTIEFWTYLTSYGSGLGLVAQGPFPGSCAGWTFGMSVNSSGQLQAGAWAAFDMYSGAATVPLNTWTHVAATWGSTGAKLYINGALVGSDPNTGMPAGGYGGSVLMNYSAGSLTTQIDELRISNVQRTDF